MIHHSNILTVDHLEKDYSVPRKTPLRKVRGLIKNISTNETFNYLNPLKYPVLQNPFAWIESITYTYMRKTVKFHISVTIGMF